ncbi:MAG TPA: adenosylhomocysteinase, partial [Solirubrobacteraceae bacterium]|nr:adenosylhomocysteinase [Solirubrobacteraceae bacterium]
MPPSAGAARIEWAGGQMPVLRSIRARFAAERPLDGLRVGACLHVTAETANLVLALRDGGADVALCAANPYTAQSEVAEALGDGVHVGDYDAGLHAVAASDPDIVLDDGAELIAATHERLRGATEETRSGLVHVRSLDLRCPVLAVNEAEAERALNDRFGTGQSALDGIVRATHMLLAGQTVAVLGYGWTGRGIALRSRGAGASVVVCEVDPLRALEARMEGFEVLTALAAAERGDVFITVTGSRDVLRAEHFARMKHGAVLANAGHFDVEISLPDLGDAGVQVLPLVEAFEQPDGRRLNLLARGQVVNLAAAQGHPAGVMDVSFALQALSAELLARGELEPGVQAVPPAIDAEVARLKLEALGV